MSPVHVLRFVLGIAGLGALGIALEGCNQQAVEAKLRSLEASGDATYLCVGVDKHRSDNPLLQEDRGFELSRCPDPAVEPTRKMVALVTQMATNELAVVDLLYAKVVDVDPSIPGFTFLRLPSRPGAITSTPGGEASFVGLTSPGKTGISAIPTTCLGPPRAGQSKRDITTFPACTLPSTPGEMIVLVEPPAADGTIAETCADPTVAQVVPPLAASESRDCIADVTTEHGAPGRRKLVVALPEQGQLAVIDAQELLDRRPGSFDPCKFETFDLKGAPDSDGQAQQVPPDLDSKTCQIQQPVPPPVPLGARPRPSGLTLAEDGRLFVGDLGVPTVHVIDTKSVCKLKELPSLLPMSFTAPWRTVTTSRVVVSPVTPKGKQYVYAVDATDQPTTSVMAFDVSAGSADRTPIVRNGSVRQPREVPDRISFGAPVQDIEFAFRDLPREDATTGVAEIGKECDPDPTASTNPPTPGVQQRTTADFQQGARPHLLRGLFGLVMLTSGQVIVIDIDDFDAPCRRPATTNPSLEPDFRGCRGDKDLVDKIRQSDKFPKDLVGNPWLTYSGDESVGLSNGTRTVSDEVSCNMVEPHRARAGSFGLSLPPLGLGAPSLRALPQLTLPPSVSQLTPTSRPKLLAVPFAGAGTDAERASAAPVDPVVYVGTTRYEPTSNPPLQLDPSDAGDRNSLALPLVEPRSYPSSESNRLVYEGSVLAIEKQSGFVDETGSAITDTSGLFCNSGVYDVAAMADYAQNVLGMSAADAQPFAMLHTDYVQITGDFPSVIDSYWQSAAAPKRGRADCDDWFKQPRRTGSSELDRGRDLIVLESYQDHLVVAPRPAECVLGSADFDATSCASHWVNGVYTPGDDAELWHHVEQCFPGGIRYTVRGSNQWVLTNNRSEVLHDLVADPANGYRCMRDCDPRKTFYRNRAFEIGTTPTCGGAMGNADQCKSVAVGLATSADGPCSYDPLAPLDPLTGKPSPGVVLNTPAAACIFENLTARFAVYRGQEPSVRDMAFTWETTGGFYALAGSLASVSSAVLPQRVKYISEYQAISVIDAASLGVSLMSLDSLRIQDPWPVY